MTVHILPASLTTDEALHELIIQSLDEILGPNNELIAPRLPFDGYHLLAIDKDHKLAIISYDNKDGGKALLSGIAALEKFNASRALLYRLYPRLSEITTLNEDALSIENTRLIILAPQTIAGTRYLMQLLPNVSVFTYHALQINDDIGLLIEPSPQHTNGTKPSTTPAPSPIPEFRTGRFNLNEEEEMFFQEI